MTFAKKLIGCLVLLTFCFFTYAETTKEKSMKFGMQTVLTAVPEKGDELAEIMLVASQIVSEIEGCELYLVQQALTDKTQILITELWVSAEHHQASLKNEKVIELITKAKPIISGVDGKPAKLIGGHGINN